MRFAARYETLCALTRGEVETFAARDRRSGEKVLAYIFDCSEPPADQPSVQWILSAFAAMAPEPPSKVTDVGRYDVPSFAYIVAKWPGDEEAEAWVRGYKAGTNAEVALDPASPVPSRANGTEYATSTVGACAPAVSKEQVPRAEPAMSGQAVESSQSTPTVSGAGEADSLPAINIHQEFFQETSVANRNQWNDGPALTPLGTNLPHHESGVGFSDASKSDTHPDTTPSLTKSTVPEADQSWPTQGSGQFTKLFLGDSIPSRSAPDTFPQVRDELPQDTSGAFTKLFEAPADDSPRVGSPSKDHFETAPHGSQGEFTHMFGSDYPEKSERDAGTVARDASRDYSPGASSTEIFGWRPPDGPPEMLESAGTRSDIANNAPIRESHDFTDSTGTSPFHESLSTNVFSPKDTFQEVAPLQPSHVPQNSDSANATVGFDPRSAARGTDAAAPSGPSDYTVFMQRSALSGLQAEAAEEAPPRSSGGSGLAGAGSALPSATIPYQPPTFQPPAYPPVPSARVPVAPPAPPSLSAPAPQAPAAPGQASPGKASYLPLIIILNVLIIVAILLILYLFIKH